jgi:hypothetical protein
LVAQPPSRCQPTLSLAEQAAILIRCHLGHDFRRERTALPEAVESGSLGEIATIQDD